MNIPGNVRSVRMCLNSFFGATLCFALAGCQSPMGPGASLQADPSDPCMSERAAFAGSKTYFQDKIATGAATGAAVGAGLGALTGLAAGGNLKSALVGGLVGGAVGGVAGAGSAYYNTLAERARDQDELAYAMNQDLARETQEIDHTTATFARLRACRFGQAQFVKNQARNHQLDRPTALARIAYHRDRFAQEVGIAHQFGLTMAQRSQQFQEAANDLRTRPPVTRGAVATRAAPTRVASVDRAASVSVPEKRASFDRTVASAERSSKAAFDLDTNANLSWLLPSVVDA
jgi:hypothetical protein